MDCSKLFSSVLIPKDYNSTGATKNDHGRFHALGVTSFFFTSCKILILNTLFVSIINSLIKDLFLRINLKYGNALFPCVPSITFLWSFFAEPHVVVTVPTMAVNVKY